jgi:hypothetical protein
MAAAANTMQAMDMLLPKPFFSYQTPRQAPGNSSVMRPYLGRKSPKIRQAKAAIAKATAKTSTSFGQS